MARKVPRPFAYSWGSGRIVEEATAPNEFYEPALQLLVVEGGEHDGEEHLRFCFYSPGGSFQRHPLVVNREDIAELRRALGETPRIRAMLRELAGE
ncbi:hypothetical protein [Bailinhaonella thermotolerans]|uniref:Uncharacterized protein n=1 Tax=Bailinhaonella thermotolerans TaxID=1070861 RepID=A0A3A4AD34_9ACTN|nr:hypothetical protein [Bailinhaonella thermotolerans]RJL27226.1 hypothetical protein D5H75_25890 [Bailinhaonella thermotolerans]